jgi:hypothetical protein
MSEWRPVEQVLIDYFRRRGDPLRDICGRPFLATEIFDDDTGQLRETRRVVDLEKLARHSPAQSNRVVSVSRDRPRTRRGRKFVLAFRCPIPRLTRAAGSGGGGILPGLAQ